MNDHDPVRAARRAGLESHAHHIERAGRDLFILGIVAAVFLYFGHPGLPAFFVPSVQLFAGLAPLVYLAALLIGFRLRAKAGHLT